MSEWPRSLIPQCRCNGTDFATSFPQSEKRTPPPFPISGQRIPAMTFSGQKGPCSNRESKYPFPLLSLFAIRDDFPSHFCLSASAGKSFLSSRKQVFQHVEHGTNECSTFAHCVCLVKEHLGLPRCEIKLG